MRPSYIQAAEAKQLYEARRAQEAVAIMRELMLREPREESHRIQLALYLRAIGAFDESLFYVDKVSPTTPGYKMLKGWHLLREGKFKEGMRMRESEGGIYRMETLHSFPKEKRYTYGTPLSDKRVLLVLEGGNGDEIAYVRFAQFLKKQGAQVTAVASPGLRSIISRARDVDAVIDAQAIDHASYDYYIPAMSIFALFDIEDPKDSIDFPYVTPDDSMVAKWQPILAQVSSGKRKIGIQWQGNPEFDHVEFKTLPAQLLASFADYGSLYLIQRPETITQDNTFPNDVPAFNTQTEAPNWEQTLAVISEMDVIIAGDTTITHMAGALGKETYALLPHAPHPYWADLKEISTWYPSVHACRQTEYNDWKGAANHAEKQLKKAVYPTNENVVTALIQKAEAHYNNADYQKTLETIYELHAAGLNNDLLRVYEAECLYYAGEAAKAADIMRMLLEKDPKNSSHAMMLSQYLRALGEFEESFTLLARVNPETPGFYAHYGWHLLRRGEFLEGYRTLHREINTTDITGRLKLPPHKKLYKGADIRGKRLFLILDGGFGDQILSVRFAKTIRELGAEVIIGMNDPLLSIFRRIPFVTDARFLTDVREDEYDYYLSGIWSLDLFDITDPSAIIDFPYITPLEGEVAKLTPLIEEAAQGKKKIGIHWQGNLQFHTRDMKSVPAAHMLDLAELGTLFSLQRDAGENTLLEDTPVIDLQKGDSSWDYTLAAISLMDIVVTNDASVAHMAGAAGKKTIVLSPLVPSIYWLPFSEKSIWYPTVQICYQERYNDWKSALAEAAILIEAS